jgi:hypothetical protein
MTEREQADTVERTLAGYRVRVVNFFHANDEHDHVALDCGHTGISWRNELARGDLTECTVCRTGVVFTANLLSRVR